MSRRRPRGRLELVALVLFAVVFAGVQLLQLHLSKGESPLDHAKTTLLSPLYKTRCQRALRPGDIDDDSFCRQRRPPIVMISARSPEQRLESNASWQALPADWRPRVLDTKPMSAELADVARNDCPDRPWAYRLFRIYERVFRQLLNEYPATPNFVLLEDDAILHGAELFATEVCRAQTEGQEFFSLYRATRQNACIYHSGTVAFFISRAMMEYLIDVPLSSKCRLPIDIFLATSGPWFATMQDIVLHKSTRVKALDS
ncbi:hypothetical protein ATCC90586_009662 [Pythium insidiosum]|nr:hypothetical protein ATCC90586_009662 [Pythium insidiosum]